VALNVKNGLIHKNKILRGKIMFGKKNLYEIVWENHINHCAVIIAAKNEEKALKQFYKRYSCHIPSIVSFREYKNNT
jgi:hypothetical protein